MCVSTGQGPNGELAEKEGQFMKFVQYGQRPCVRTVTCCQQRVPVSSEHPIVTLLDFCQSTTWAISSSW